MRFLEMLLDVGAKLLDGSLTAKRTLCCDVLMWDVWMHAETCPNYRKMRAAGACQPKAGDTSFPTGHYGIYTVGKPCSWCGYADKRS